MAERRFAGREAGSSAPADAGPLTRQLNARGRQGELRFVLQRMAAGLYVERQELPRRGLHATQGLCFGAAFDFARWCDDDPVRFEHPQLYLRLKREAEQLWSLDAPTARD